MSGISDSGIQAVASDGSSTMQTKEQIEMTKLFRYFANVKTKACTSDTEKQGATEASPAVVEQLPPPRRFLRRNRSFSYTPSGPAPAKLSPCACGADEHSTCGDAAWQATNYDMMLEFLMDPTSDPLS